MSATQIGPAPSDTINHAAPTFCMNAPISEMRSATSKFRKIETRRGPRRLNELLAAGSVVSVNRTSPLLLRSVESEVTQRDRYVLFPSPPLRTRTPRGTNAVQFVK